MALTRKQRAFIDAYILSWNASEAARTAGYSGKTAYSIGARLLKNVEISDEIARILEERAMGRDEVLARLADQGRAGYTRYLQPDGTVDLASLLADDKGHLVRGTKWDRNGNLVVQFYDAQSALVQLLHHHDRQGTADDPFHVQVTVDVRERLRSRISRIAARSREADGAGPADHE